MIKSYFEAACAIHVDVHNHLRQDGLTLERTVDWWFRCLCTIVHVHVDMIEVDAFKAYSYFNAHTCTAKHEEFVEKLAIPLLTSEYKFDCYARE